MAGADAHGALLQSGRVPQIRSGVITTVGICDALYHLVQGGELALPLQVEATPILQPGDQVQARFGLIEGHLINIVTVDPTRTFTGVLPPPVGIAERESNCDRVA